MEPGEEKMSLKPDYPPVIQVAELKMFSGHVSSMPTLSSTHSLGGPAALRLMGPHSPFL